MPTSNHAGPKARRRDAVLTALELFAQHCKARRYTAFISFLYVCENEGINVTELMFLSGFTIQSAARVVRSMAEQGGDGGPGPLLEVRSGLPDRRLKSLYLTPLGQDLRRQLDAIIAEGSPIDRLRRRKPVQPALQPEV